MTLILNLVLNLLGIIDFFSGRCEGVDGEEMSKEKERCMKTNRKREVVPTNVLGVYHKNSFVG